MKAWSTTAADIRAAAEEVGVRIAGWPPSIVKAGRALRFTLATSGPTSDGKPVKYGRLSQLRGKQRRIPGHVCWHGHRDFFRALYKRCPKARIKTAMADYRSVEDFEKTHRETAWSCGREGGWLGAVVPIDQACDCAESGA